MNRRILILIAFAFISSSIFSQTNPVITSWIRNTTGITGRHYISGNSTPISDAYSANVQNVKYSATYAYVYSSGVPSYIVGPYLDGNPTLTSAQSWISKFLLTPIQNTGTATAVGMGNIGILKNGVPIYNYADGKSYNNANVWHQNAIYFERVGFDCAKGHPSMGGKYHHHQNPSAFNLDKVVISTVCNLYLADGLYVMDSTNHSPLIGYAFDGFPIYGAYGYANANGTGGIKRIQSSYQFQTFTSRTNGPSFATFPLGAYKEDFLFVAGSGDLDDHNGRFAVTPEYPLGTYAYYTTVDANQNSAYPYIIGPTYYGVVTAGNITNTVSVETGLTTYTGSYMTLSATSTNVSCNGGNNGSITLNILGGNSPFTYNWGGGITSVNRTTLAAGTYSVTVTDKFGQTATLTKIITQPSALVPTLTPTTTPCGTNAGSITSSVGGGTSPYTYLWSNGLTTSSLSNLAAGTYSVIVTDAKGCTSTSSAIVVATACNTTVNVKLFLQGFYAGLSTMTPVLANQGVGINSLVTDTIEVQLRNTNSPYGIVATTKAILQTNGNAVSTFPFISGSYYIAMKHRNGLQTWSATPVTVGTSPITYDFTTASNKAYGNNMIEMEPGKWAIFSGDLNADENIDLVDYSVIETDINLFSGGYFATDLNGDGNVDLLDATLAEGNVNAFIFSSHP